MKKRLIILASLALILAIGVTVVFVVHDAGAMSRRDYAQSEIGRLAVWIEMFWEDNGRYPDSLQELAAEYKEQDIDADREWQALLRYGFHVGYEKKPDGFNLTVAGIDSWRPRYDTIQRTFSPGETSGMAGKSTTIAPPQRPQEHLE